MPSLFYEPLLLALAAVAERVFGFLQRQPKLLLVIGNTSFASDLALPQR